jgi:hypothetical protein
MDVHQNARTTPHSRAKIVARAGRGESAREIAAALEIGESTGNGSVGTERRESRVSATALVAHVVVRGRRRPRW